MANTLNGDQVPIVRKSADFHPSVWGDRFDNYVPDDKIINDRNQERQRELIDEVKKEILKTGATSPIRQQLELVDDIQRLGIGYHFEKELGEVLQHIYEMHKNCNVDDSLDDLYYVSLRFRLLRQQGFNISCDVFNKFRDDSGHFKETLTEDTKGILSLYEATFMRKHGEDILDEALPFTKSHLELIQNSSHLSKPLIAQVKRALTHPFRQSILRLEARHYMTFYHEIDSHNETVLELAKLDYNLVQSLHKTELSEITKWWNILDFTTKLPFARNRIVEVYFWTVGIYYEPQYAIGRILQTKMVMMLSYLDDIYDVYGTHEELELFTNVITRWDINEVDQLPDYMQYCFRAILNICDDIEEEMAKRGRSYSVHYVKEAMKRQANVYFNEIKWYNEEYVPTLEEYIDNALVSSVYPFMSLLSFLGVDDLATKEVYEWGFSIPKVVRATSIIGRLLDDIVSHKFEQSRGHTPSAIECCMAEFNVPEEQAYGIIRKRLENEWKVLNEACLNPTEVAMPLMTIFSNMASAAEIFYKEGDNFTHVGKEMQTRISLMFIDPAPI